MDPFFIHHFNKFSEQLNLLNEYIELKFGSDFKEFLAFKASRPNNVILVPDDGSHHQFHRDDNVDISGVIEEEPEDPANQGEQGDHDNVEIRDQDVSNNDWEQGAGAPVIRNVYPLEPEDSSIRPAFHDNNGIIGPYFYQANGRSCQYLNGDADDQGEGENDSSADIDNQQIGNGHVSSFFHNSSQDAEHLEENVPSSLYQYHNDGSSTVYHRPEQIDNDAESSAVLNNSSPQEDDDLFVIRLTTSSPNNPTIPSKRKTLPPKKRGVMINPNEGTASKESFIEEITNPENPPERKRFKCAARMSMQPGTGIRYRSTNCTCTSLYCSMMRYVSQCDYEDEDDDDSGSIPQIVYESKPQVARKSQPAILSSESEYDEEQQDDFSDEGSPRLPITKIDNCFTGDNSEELDNPERPPERKRFNPQVARKSEPAQSIPPTAHVRVRQTARKSEPATMTRMREYALEKQRAAAARRRAQQSEILQRKRTSIQSNNHAGTTRPNDPTGYIPKIKRSKIYSYFDLDETLRKYTCKRCRKSYPCARQGGTGSLHYHLENKHPDLYKEFHNDASSP